MNKEREPRYYKGTCPKCKKIFKVLSVYPQSWTICDRCGSTVRLWPEEAAE